MDCTLYADGYIGEIPWLNGQETDIVATGSAIVDGLFDKRGRNAFWYGPGKDHTDLEADFMAAIDAVLWVVGLIEAPGLNTKGVDIELRVCSKDVVLGIMTDVKFTDERIEELCGQLIHHLEQFASYEIVYINEREMASVIGATETEVVGG